MRDLASRSAAHVPPPGRALLSGLGPVAADMEDAAFQVINLVKSLGAHEGGGFFAADSARAKHGHPGRFAVLGGQAAAGLHLLGNPLGQL